MEGEHRCIRRFPTIDWDDCYGEGTNECHGTSDMVLEVWYPAQDGQESFYDECMVIKVNYCPFCGIKKHGVIS